MVKLTQIIALRHFLELHQFYKTKRHNKKRVLKCVSIILPD